MGNPFLSYNLGNGYSVKPEYGCSNGVESYKGVGLVLTK
jgi:hypothetical protein